MIAMQSYNGFGRLRVQKFRLTFINAGMGWGLERCMMNFFEKNSVVDNSLAEARRQDKNFTSTADKRVEARSANKFDGNKGRLKVEIRRQASGTRYESGWYAISRGGGERCGGLCVINV